MRDARTAANPLKVLACRTWGQKLSPRARAHVKNSSTSGASREHLQGLSRHWCVIHASRVRHALARRGMRGMAMAEEAPAHDGKLRANFGPTNRESSATLGRRASAVPTRASIFGTRRQRRGSCRKDSYAGDLGAGPVQREGRT
jgi:hypothetical protein